ncbi:unnamed protein product [Trichogramma brassicae]|uniref:Endonuclease/exonuclease/phosphatase domain-containing protein n=1 Tax=Trichogramma brassicae TaxID=86971 RepID=A0A6H5IME4_9HYME|nr:unnamed protein product [Trichogramma brassicae]
MTSLSSAVFVKFQKSDRIEFGMKKRAVRMGAARRRGSQQHCYSAHFPSGAWQGSSIVDLTLVCETLTPRVKSWTVSGWYKHSDHQDIVFEIEDTGTSTRPSTRQSCRWNARTLDADRFSAAVSSASVAPGTAEDMASSLMSVITGACDASMSKVNPRRRREPVYWWTAEIADLRRSCGLADSSRDREAGSMKKPTARTTPPQGIFCVWRSRPVSVGAGGSFATRSTATSGANHTRLPCRAYDARRPSSPAPLCWCAARWRLCSRGCRAGPLAAAATSGGAYTGRHLGGTQRSSVEEQGALRARPGWHTQLSAQNRYYRPT